MTDTRPSAVKIALAMIVKGDDKEAERLAKCLEFVHKHVDGIFITITQPNVAVEEVAKFYNATVSHFEWCDDFAKARNYNFSQVPKEFTHILWLDADDGLRGGELLKPTLEQNPEIDAFAINYLYAFDEWKNPIVVHTKTQILRNNGSVEWAGSLHEDFKPLREVKTFFIKGIERIHLTDDARINENKARNLRISKEQVARNPNDPRSFWNLGNSYKAKGLNQEAIDAFSKFIELSDSDDEKYIARLRRAESYWAMGDKTKGIDEANYAIGLKPEYPDAHHLKGSLLFENRQYQKAAECYKLGLVCKPPYYQIMVYNPRDYDYVPLMNLAKCYFNLNLPSLALVCLQQCLKIQPKDTSLRPLIADMKKEVAKFNQVTKLITQLQKIKDLDKLKAAIDKIPKKFQMHPGILNIRNTKFPKTESSGKDVVFYCGPSAESWSPETAKTKGIGGSEEAVIHMAELLAELGWNVSVYNMNGEAKKYGKVEYKHYLTWNYRDKQDVVILWRTPRLLDYEINATSIFVDMHDVIPEGEFTPERVNKLTKIFVKSKFQRSLFPKVPDDKFEIIPNGIDVSVFGSVPVKDSNLIVNTSSPDRSLTALVKIFPEVKKEVPGARMLWAYGWSTFDVGYGENMRVMQWKQKMKDDMKAAGIEELGRVSHSEVAKLYLDANVWFYPSEFGEIDCISASKAMAAGAWPVTTDFAALGEKTGHGGVFVHSDKTKDDWAMSYQYDFSVDDPVKLEQLKNHLIQALKNPPSLEEREGMRKWAIETFDWKSIAKRWDEVLKVAVTKKI